MDALLAEFVAETRSQLLAIAGGLEVLRADPGNLAEMERVFRSVHTIKGSAAVFAFAPIQAIAHESESLLGEAREHRRPLPDGATALLFEAFDAVALWVEPLQSAQLPEFAEREGAALAARIAALGGSGSLSRKSGTDSQAVRAELLAGLPRLPAAVREALAAAGGSYAYVRYQPDPGCFFAGEDPLYTARQLPGLDALHLEIAPAAPGKGDPAFGPDSDPYRCDTILHAFCRARLADLDALLRPLGEQAHALMIEADALATPAPTADPLHEAARGLVARQLELLAASDGDRRSAALPSVRAVIGNVARTLGPESGLEGLEALDSKLLALRLRAWLESTGAAAPSAPAEAPAAAPQEEELRVSPALAERIMSAATELAITRTALSSLTRRLAALKPGPIASEFAGLQQQLDHQLRELQAGLQELRLLPLDEVFRRLPMQLRLLERQLGKAVTLTVSGEELRADKAVCALLHEPLLHLVRNALDHGIESAAERAAAGKPASARITVAARREQDRLLIHVEDDGRGIDPARMRARALESGLRDEATLAMMDDAGLLQLVFESGFSTAATVSDISGRGMGMEIVRDRLRAAGGNVSLESVVGSGTQVTLSLPVAVAVAQVLLVAVGGQSLGLPLSRVHEIVRPREEQILCVKRSESLQWRGRIVPLVRLARVLSLPVPAAPPPACIVLNLPQGPLALGVDEVGENLDVMIKPLSGVLTGLSCYEGSALLGDGSVLLVINPLGLV
ncbi:chemotaxis protein CheA [Niveibacterium sp. SC-1]|uniref:chemotaxis protein CheA n=1 Tax=Niveibacterium sp. SC-1 TaxID=3135646 RepID=UPI00311E1122